MDIVNLLISLASGVLGGNLSGSTMKEYSLGTAGNSVAGLAGGALGNFLLQALGVLGAPGVAEYSISSIITNIGASGVTGAVLPIIISLIRKYLGK